jgi:hypothetical protein
MWKIHYFIYTFTYSTLPAITIFYKTRKYSVKLHGDLQRIYPNRATRKKPANISFKLLSEIWIVSMQTVINSTFARQLLFKND